MSSRPRPKRFAKSAVSAPGLRAALRRQLAEAGRYRLRRQARIIAHKPMTLKTFCSLSHAELTVRV
jgi:hypothetical protein